MEPECARGIGALAAGFAGRPTLEIGTSRGHLAAILASRGCRLTTLDALERGARRNLDGLGVDVVVSDAEEFLADGGRRYDFIVVDLHGNRKARWRRLWPLLEACLAPEGTMVLYNSHLWKIEEFKAETGLRWVMRHCLAGFATEVFEEPAPGMVVCRRK